MSIIDKIKEWFSIPEYKRYEKPLKTLKDLDFFDDVWIKDGSSILKGWIFDLNKKHIIITIPTDEGEFLDYRFTITKPLNQTELNQYNKTLYFNDPCK